MGVNRFVLNGVSYHGHGAINEIPGIIKSKGFKKAFVASDPDLVKFGVTTKVTDLLEQNGIEYEIYSDIKPNPTIENVQSGVAAYKASGADFMITIGGGSSMDTGKGIGIIVNNPEYADVRSLEGVAPTKNRTVFTIAVPTTGGTGGIVTLEDLVEEIFGEIEDEHDSTNYVARDLGNNEYLLSARIEIAKANELLDLDLPESDEYLTVGGLILHEYQSFPKLNEVVKFGQYEFKILQNTTTKIELVRLKVLN